MNKVANLREVVNEFVTDGGEVCLGGFTDNALSATVKTLTHWEYLTLKDLLIEGLDDFYWKMKNGYEVN